MVGASIEVDVKLHGHSVVTDDDMYECGVVKWLFVSTDDIGADKGANSGADNDGNLLNIGLMIDDVYSDGAKYDGSKYNDIDVRRTATTP